MAELLYRIGRSAALRPGRVIAVWTAVLLAAVLAYTFGAGTLTGAIAIPGTPTAEVTERLEREFPEVAGGTGNVVLRSDDGAPLTAEQRSTLSERIAAASAVPGVRAVVDPFAADEERAATEQQLADGQAQLEQGRAEIEAGQARLDAAQAEIEAGRAELEQAREQAAAAGVLDQVGPELEAQAAALEEGAARIEAEQAALVQGAAELEAQAAQVETGAALAEMAREIRTVSADGSAAVATVLFTETGFEVTDETKQALMDAFGQAPVPGVEVDFSASIAEEIPDILGVGEAVGVLVAAVVLFVMLGTLIAAGLPVLTALVGVGIGALSALSLSGVVEMVSVTPVLGVMLGLAVGIDYSLFILNRHRRQLRQGDELVESIGLANGTSGNAVVFAGSTVLIALLALNVTGIPFLGLMGNVAAFSVAVAVLIAVTLTPALLGLIGHRVLPARERAQLATAPAQPAAPRPMSTPGALGRALVGVVGLGILALPAASLRLGLPDGSSEAPESTQYQAYTTIDEQFGPGQNGTLLVVADLPAPADEAEGLPAQLAVAEQLYAQDDVVAVAPVGTSADGTVAAFQVIPAEGPSAESTADLVNHLRDLGELADGVPIAVAGQASGAIDISAKLADALPLYLALVVGLSLVILTLVFRSLVVPVIATAGFVLSYFATVGAVVAIYQWGWLGGIFDVHAPGPVLNFLPTVLVGVLFGLAMDYMLFIGSGVREAYAHGAPARLAVVQGVRAGRAVVTAAALIMASVFGGFVFAESLMIRPIGFALAFGVLVDAFVVRMLIVPALLHLAGEGAWWLPRWLDRLLPDVDVEGAALERRHPHHVTGTAPSGPESGG